MDRTDPLRPLALAGAARRRDRRGGTVIEYGLIVSLVTLVMLSAAYQLYQNVQIMWNSIAAAMP